MCVDNMMLFSFKIHAYGSISYASSVALDFNLADIYIGQIYLNQFDEITWRSFVVEPWKDVTFTKFKVKQHLFIQHERYLQSILYWEVRMVQINYSQENTLICHFA